VFVDSVVRACTFEEWGDDTTYLPNTARDKHRFRALEKGFSIVYVDYDPGRPVLADAVRDRAALETFIRRGIEGTTRHFTGYAPDATLTTKEAHARGVAEAPPHKHPRIIIGWKLFRMNVDYVPRDATFEARVAPRVAAFIEAVEQAHAATPFELHTITGELRKKFTALEAPPPPAQGASSSSSA
jgi:hypothetical protein